MSLTSQVNQIKYLDKLLKEWWWWTGTQLSDNEWDKVSCLLGEAFLEKFFSSSTLAGT